MELPPTAHSNFPGISHFISKLLTFVSVYLEIWNWNWSSRFCFVVWFHRHQLPVTRRWALFAMFCFTGAGCNFWSSCFLFLEKILKQLLVHAKPDISNKKFVCISYWYENTSDYAFVLVAAILQNHQRRRYYLLLTFMNSSQVIFYVYGFKFMILLSLL